MREIQQLVYRDGKLFCPRHPDHPLEEGRTVSDEGTFSIVCLAPNGPRGNCMNSAQWPSREDMDRDLARENS